MSSSLLKRHCGRLSLSPLLLSSAANITPAHKQTKPVVTGEVISKHKCIVGGNRSVHFASRCQSLKHQFSAGSVWWAEWLFEIFGYEILIMLPVRRAADVTWQVRFIVLSCKWCVFRELAAVREHDVRVCLCVQRPRVEFMSLPHSSAPIERSPLQSD